MARGRGKGPGRPKGTTVANGAKRPVRRHKTAKRKVAKKAKKARRR